jgi:DNA topoisomerase I
VPLDAAKLDRALSSAAALNARVALFGTRAGAAPPEARADGSVSVRQMVESVAAKGDDAEFRESDHPRDQDGKFSGAGGGGMKPLDRAAQPEHITALKVPPAWKDVHYNADPAAPLQVIGLDAKGRTVRIYSEKFATSQSAVKFRRIEELDRKFGTIWEQNERGRTTPETRDSADCVRLIMQMGVRPGSDDDTGAKVKAYGATTLKGEHVIADGDATRLRFVGKKGVAIDLPVEDVETAKMLRDRAAASGPDGRLFPKTDDKKLLDYVHTFDGGGFKTKDFRTLLATKTARDAVAADPMPPKDDKEYRKKVMAVAALVSKRLGNTPVVALQSYISPTVFAEWRRE